MYEAEESVQYSGGRGKKRTELWAMTHVDDSGGMAMACRFTDEALSTCSMQSAKSRRMYLSSSKGTSFTTQK